ncbi:MAG: hypothetical protein WC307_05915 [Candidatus Nanoarchaeia archaeon]|jgi:hypothetical protein
MNFADTLRKRIPLDVTSMIDDLFINEDLSKPDVKELYINSLRNSYNHFSELFNEVELLELSMPASIVYEVRIEMPLQDSEIKDLDLFGDKNIILTSDAPLNSFTSNELLFYLNELVKVKGFYDEVINYFDENEMLFYILSDFKEENPGYPNWSLKTYELFYDALINENEGLCLDDYVEKEKK